ncbi:yippee zinc-binding/DNA-binding /Mis18, centromere assembly-domain-containing protein [Kockiozyma suomiensis]|uniref:yippee zinc-binding/DNA-binding /Mis18, centromere assembly-domain-containing protein n=1 Tax=Kockiozyma suomiensis TaxID=1337062 RepID=UPI003343D01F
MTHTFLAPPRSSSDSVLFPSHHAVPLIVFSCAKCQTHIASHSSIVSKAFTGRFGHAVLVRDARNVINGAPCERMLISGLHSVADISCAGCNANLGWKYIATGERSQKYKVGCYILELRRVLKESVVTSDLCPSSPFGSLTNDNDTLASGHIAASSDLRQWLDKELARKLDEETSPQPTASSLAIST